MEDLQYLVEDVWTFCSAKDSSALDGLDFIRWDRQKDWSPWNCILLPREETWSHREVKDLHQVGPPHQSSSALSELQLLKSLVTTPQRQLSGVTSLCVCVCLRSTR